MIAKRQSKLLAFALFCIAGAGTTFALVSTDIPDERAGPDAPWIGELRPSLAADAEPSDTLAHDRFAFVPPEIGAFELPDEPVEPADLAAAPQSWSVEVSEEDAAPPPGKARPPYGAASSTPGGKAPVTRYSLKERLAMIAPGALQRVMTKFQAAEVAWPPAELAYVAIKDEKVLEVHARAEGGGWKFVHRYKVLAASGSTGPKILRGDRQVPEGIYGISYLNPNSAYHVSLRVNYPNAFDREMAAKDGRRDLGGDIMIHGKNASAGCLAVGDDSAEELFVLAAEVGIGKVKVVIAPTDFRRNKTAVLDKGPDWVPKLYGEIATAMAAYKAPPPPSSSFLSLLGF